MEEYSSRFLFRNRPENKLTEENDLFELIPKAAAITKVLKSCIYSSDERYDNNMIALYGNWGSGKTSLMRYIEKELTEFNTPKTIGILPLLKKKDLGMGSCIRGVKETAIKTVFFEAWKYEKDSNLALSLFEQILDEMRIDKYLKNDIILANAIKICKSFLKNLLYTTKIKLALPLDISVDPAVAIQKTEEQMKKSSMYTKDKQLKSAFKVIDETIKKHYKKTIIFIDDLDRCEPENVLNLLSAIKLFFTYSNETIYFCGIDKDAVSKAISHKYKDIIKSEEYLEKVFDITFNMPISNNVRKVVESYFNHDKKNESTFNNCCKYISEFLENIGFTNPRHVKKAFNKLELLRRFKDSIEDLRFPDIRDDKNILLIIFTLYLIILHEFKKDKFDEIFSFNEKFESYKAFFRSNRSESAGYQVLFDNIQIPSLCKSIQESYKDDFMNTYLNLNNKAIIKLVHIFLPNANKEFYLNASDSSDMLKSYINQFSDYNNDILITFLNFILDNFTSNSFNLNNTDNFKLCDLVYAIKSYL